MSVVSVKARSFILALFIRDDGERFLLGDNGYDFKDSQLHFAANTIENDEVMKQGADGVMVAGQVRRASVQSFDGFVGDATMAKETIEQMRRDFFAFFVKGHHFRVVYIDCNRNAWQRKGGYLVDAPEVKELWQIHPEYHVGLNFEDVNYYSYDEDADGEEILSNLVDVPVSTAASGGLVWDEDGAVSEDAEVEYDSETADASGKSIPISDADNAPFASFQLDGETSQNGTPTPSAPVPVNTVTGENVVQICGKNLYDEQLRAGDISKPTSNPTIRLCSTQNLYLHPGTYTFSSNIASPMRYALGVNSVSAPPTGTYPTYIYDSGWTVGTGSNTTTFTINQSGYFSVQLSKVNNAELTTSEAQAYHYQLELSSTATAYEPYQGQSYEVNLGKNLYNPSTTTTTGVFYQNIHTELGIYPGETYTFNITDSRTYASVRLYNSSGTLTRALGNNRTDHTITFTAASNEVKAALEFYAGNNTDVSTYDFTGVQLELGSQATSYAAYFGPIELCKIGTYQDYIYKSGGKWYVHKECGKVILDGVNKSFSDRYTTSGSHYRFVYADQSIPNYTAGTVAQIYCNRLIGGTMGNTYGRVERIAYNDANNRLIMYISSIEDYTIAAANTWLESNPITVYYALATPTDTEITNSTLVGQLNALLTTARTYAGINNIFTITPNEQGTLEVGYYTKYQPIVTGGYVWEAGGAGGATIVVNNSIDSVNPIWKIYGPTMNPQLENSTTGEVIEYVGLIAEGQTLTIDMGEQTASLDGLNVISNLVGDFISLAPGANRLIYSVSGDAGASEIGWSEIVG